MSTSSTKTPPEVHYPESDGKPMGETQIHVYTNLEIYGTLNTVLFRNSPDIYVTADMFFYYEEGNPRAVKAPDVMFVKGVHGKHERRTYKLWVENVVPRVIFEITSSKTRKEDTVTKRDLYARLGVAEYFLFDPLGDYLKPRLQGYRLEGDQYSPISPDRDGVFESLHLGLKLRAEGTGVRLIDPRTNEPIPSIFELPALADDRKQAIEFLERDLTEQRKQSEREHRKAVRESKKAEAERQKAEAERHKAEALQAEVDRLRALLRERGLDDPARSTE
jgi:Uma2 family endonuclease